jgi:ATP-dependent RNA helicase RhlE
LGKAISFCDEDEKEYLSDIQKLIGKQIPIIEEHPYPLATGSKMPLKFSKSKPRTSSSSSQKKFTNYSNQRFGQHRNKPRGK